MASDKIDIHHISTLARLELSSEEEQLFESQLEKIVEHVEKLSEIDLSDVPPTDQAGTVINAIREDVAGDSISQEATLSNAPQSARGQIVVPRVIE